tara:strand:- start:131 stop:610 length:480 start_codon:yes stop_codon:yes gene_type:complete
MSNECIELKNIKYKSMLLNGNGDEKEETVENLSNLDLFLADEKKSISNEPWTKLDKTTKLLKFNDFIDEYIEQHKYSQDDKTSLFNFLSTNLDRKRLLKTKEVLYNKETGKILSIPSLIYNTSAKKFTLKRCDKRQSTLKSLAPKKNRIKKNDKIDINN